MAQRELRNRAYRRRSGATTPTATAPSESATAASQGTATPPEAPTGAASEAEALRSEVKPDEHTFHLTRGQLPPPLLATSPVLADTTLTAEITCQGTGAFLLEVRTNNDAASLTPPPTVPCTTKQHGAHHAVARQGSQGHRRLFRLRR